MKLQTRQEIANYIMESKADMKPIGTHFIKYSKDDHEILLDLNNNKKYSFQKIEIDNGFIRGIIGNGHEYIWNQEGKLVSPDGLSSRNIQIINKDYIFIRYIYTNKDKEYLKYTYICDKNGTIVSTSVSSFQRIYGIKKDIIIGVKNDMSEGVTDFYGNVIIPFKNQNISFTNRNNIIVDDEKTITIYNLKGEIINQTKKRHEEYEGVLGDNIITCSKPNNFLWSNVLHTPEGQKKRYCGYYIIDDEHALVTTTKGKKRLLNSNGHEEDIELAGFKEINGYYLINDSKEDGIIKVYDKFLDLLFSFDSFMTDYRLYDDYLLIDEPTRLRIVYLKDPSDIKEYYHHDTTKYHGMIINNRIPLASIKDFVKNYDNKIFDLSEGVEYECPENMTYIGNGLAFAKKEIQGEKKFGIYDIQKEKYLVEPKYSYIRPCKGYFVFSLKDDGLFGVVDSVGNEILKPLFKSVEQVKNNYFNLDGKFVDINKVQLTYNIDLYSGDDLLTTRSFTDFDTYELIRLYLENKVNEINKKEDEYLSQLHQEGISEVNSADYEEIKKIPLVFKPNTGDKNQ